MSIISLFFSGFFYSNKIHGIPENHKISLAHVCMEGMIVHWFSMVRELNRNLSWEEFKRELLNQYKGVANPRPYEQFPALRQNRSNIDECINNFEMIASMIPKKVESLYLRYFMNGLKEELKNLVRLLGPKSYQRLPDCQKCGYCYQKESRHRGVGGFFTH